MTPLALRRETISDFTFRAVEIRDGKLGIEADRGDLCFVATAMEDKSGKSKPFTEYAVADGIAERLSAGHAGLLGRLTWAIE